MMSSLAKHGSALAAILLLIAANLHHVTSTCSRTKASSTLDGLLLQRRVATSLSRDHILIPVNASNMPIVRAFLTKLLDYAMQKEKVDQLERTPVTITISVLMDAIISDACNYLREAFYDSTLDCKDARAIKSLHSRLEMANKVIAMADHLRRNRKVLGIDQSAIQHQSNYWQVHINCSSGSETHQELANEFYESNLMSLFRAHPPTCGCQAQP